MFTSTKKLACEHCNKAVAKVPETFNILFFRQSAELITKICVCCKGACTEAVEKNNADFQIGWQDLSNFTNPALYLQHVMTLISGLKGTKIRCYSEEALDFFKEVLLTMSSYVFRKLTDSEKEKVKFENLFNNY